MSRSPPLGCWPRRHRSSTPPRVAAIGRRPHAGGGTAKSGSAPMASEDRSRDPHDNQQGGEMQGTLLCAVSEGDESADAVELGGQLSERFGMRLVLAHAVDGIEPIDQDDES